MAGPEVVIVKDWKDKDAWMRLVVFLCTSRYSFYVEGEVWRNGVLEIARCGCVALINKQMPELIHVTKFNLCTLLGPRYYYDNTLWWLGYNQDIDDTEENLTQARAASCWPELPEFFLKSKGGSRDVVHTVLAQRLPAVRAEFRDMLATLGMTVE